MAAGEVRPETIRGTAGFFRAAQDAAGCWWLLDAAGRPFFCKGVHGVGVNAPSEPAALADAAGRLRHWGFNAIGAAGVHRGHDGGLAFLPSVDFCRAGALIQAPGLRLPDVFAPDWRRRASERARDVCTPLASNRALVGWLTDDRPGWAQPRAGAAPRPALLQLCLGLEPAFAAYHAAWEFVLALHGGKLAALARAWGVPLANKEVVRELTRTETAIATRGYARDDARWTREFARRYFAGAAAAIRAADPHHLVLGCRFGGPVGAAVLAECVYPAVDVPLIDWSELPAEAAANGPVLAGDVCWAEAEFFSARHAAGRARRLTTVERMLRRGRAALERTARHRAVAGYVWRQWLDEPGEQPPFARGLVHLNGAEACEHTELLAEFNARAESLRRASPPGEPVAIDLST